MMLRLMVSGCNGFMGRAVAAIVDESPDITIVAGVDISDGQYNDFPVFKSPAEYADAVDIIVDFSSPLALYGLITFALEKKLPLVLCATGYSPEQLTLIDQAAEHIPIFRSGNMSLGINLLADLIKRACAVLNTDFDIEIVERHHRRKLDAPSGTAIMLADAAASALPYASEYVYERESRRTPRDKHEIGISAVRGGGIVGEHEVIFASDYEVIELHHSAASREVFAAGAIRAAVFMAALKRPGLYDMSDVLGT